MNFAEKLFGRVGLTDSQILLRLLTGVFLLLVVFLLSQVVSDFVRYLLYRLKFRDGFRSQSWIIALVAAIWAITSPSRSLALGGPTTEKTEAVDANPETRYLPTPSSLLTCAVVVAGLLHELGRIRGRNLARVETAARLNHPSATAMLTEMSLRTVQQSHDDQAAVEFQQPNSDHPIFVPIGHLENRHLYVDLGVNSVISLIGSDIDAKKICSDIFRALIISTLYVSPLSPKILLITKRQVALPNRDDVKVVSSFQEALNQAILASSRTVVFSEVVLDEGEIKQFRDLKVAVVCLQSTTLASTTLFAADGVCRLSPSEKIISPFVLSDNQLSSLAALFDDVERCTSQSIEAVQVGLESLNNYKILVRVLGPVDVQLADGTVVQFEKTKTKELLAWLTSHRVRPTRSAARTALWDFNVTDATFSNVVSDVRRALNQTRLLDPTEEWIPRTFTDHLPFHESIVSDGDFLQACIDRAKLLPCDQALIELRRGLELVRDLPFAGTGYLWPDAEGITSQLVLTVINASCIAAELSLKSGDYSGVFWATAQGLKVLGAHEELFALRMRAHAARGDFAGVRFEFDSYQRAISSDSFQIAEPSAKLVALFKQITTAENVALAR